MKLKHVFPVARVVCRAGRPVIPQDMLRYDLAFAKIEQHDEELGGVFAVSDIVIFPAFKGGLGGHPTDARWRSFGIKMTFLSRADRAPVVESFLSAPEEWVTFRHPITGTWPDRCPDYSRVIPVTLARFLEAKRGQLGVCV